MSMFFAHSERHLFVSSSKKIQIYQEFRLIGDILLPIAVKVCRSIRAKLVDYTELT
jgi:hypothetical protein